jgi:hypothetical protein
MKLSAFNQNESVMNLTETPHEEIGRRNDVRRMRDARRAVETSALGSA